MGSTVVFLDANILFSAAWRKESGLLRLWKVRGLHLVTHTYAVDEAERNLEQVEQKNRLRRLLAQVRVGSGFDPRYDLDIPLPEKDIPVFRAALAAGAQVLLTGDIRHFGPYFGKSVHGIRILPPSDFLKSVVAGKYTP